MWVSIMAPGWGSVNLSVYISPAKNLATFSKKGEMNLRNHGVILTFIYTLVGTSLFYHDNPKPF